MIPAHRILSIAVAVVAVSGALALVRRQTVSPAVSPGDIPPALPLIALGENDARQLTRLEIVRPDDDDRSRTLAVTIEKRGTDWEMTAPILTQASRAAVEEAIQNLTTLHLWKQTVLDANHYTEYDLTDGTAVRIAAWRGDIKVVDLMCGKGSADGQLVRLPGRDGIFALVNWGSPGYQGFLFTRDVRNWREAAIFKFAPGDATAIEITNPNGVFGFSRNGGTWTGSRASRPREPARPWRKLDPARIEQLLRDYQSLAADNFGDRALRAASGVDDAERTGGVIRIQLSSGAPLTLRVGRPANDTSRFAITDSRWAIKEGGDGTLFILSPYTAGWATADARRFE